MLLRHRLRQALIPIALAAALGLSGCGSTRSTTARPSGFLGDLEDLTPVEASLEGKIFVREPRALAGYTRFVLDPVLVVFDADSAPAAVDPEDLARLTASLRESVAAELREGGYEVVDSAGPGVLRIRAALTDVDAAGPVANLAGKAAGIAAGVGGFVVPAIDLGGAAIEAEMLDAETGLRVAAFRDARRGKRFGGVKDASRRWGHAEAAFGVWANELRTRLDALQQGD